MERHEELRKHCTVWTFTNLMLIVRSHWMKDGAQDVLVGAALQDNLNVSLQKSGFSEEFGLCCKWFW